MVQQCRAQPKLATKTNDQTTPNLLFLPVEAGSEQALNAMDRAQDRELCRRQGLKGRTYRPTFLATAFYESLPAIAPYRHRHPGCSNNSRVKLALHPTQNRCH